MGKIVKYCAACDESFAEKFAFCPGCGQAMTAFEMNPLQAETKISDAPTAVVEDTENIKAVEPEIKSDVPIVAPVLAENALDDEIIESAETRKFFTVQPIKAAADSQTVNDTAIEDAVPENDFAPEEKSFAATAGTFGNGNSDSYQTTENDFQTDFGKRKNTPNGAYNITVIEEKNVNQRNGLLLATMVLMVSVVLGATIYSLFNKDFLVGSIDQDNPFYVTAIDDVPPPIEEQAPPVKSKDNGGGGGGGGKEEKEPASKGELPPQTKVPLNPPSVNVPQLTNPTLRYDMSTQGNIERKRTTERIGLPGSDNLNPSNGPGRGGGVGNGQGVGIGGGLGIGEGNGTGSGSGNGNGNGTGNGNGNGTENNPKPPPPPAPVGPTEAIKIISKPRANYTDAARQNQVTGVVRLRVTFSASGAISSIAPVSGLPYGLTEQAIAAARQIRFEPAKKNGVAIPSTKIIEYNFSIY